MNQTEKERTPIRIMLAMGLFALVSFLLLFGLSMWRGLNHDEHQFIASGALWANDGLLPYRDYPYFHVPYLVFVYGSLFKLSSHLLWSARLFSTICAWLTLMIIFMVAYRLFYQHKPAMRFGLAVSGALLLLANPLLMHTSGRAWNHDLPILLTVLAFLCLRRAIKGRSTLQTQPPHRWWLLLSGLFIGLASGTRLSFAIVALPFALAIVLASRFASERHTIPLFSASHLPNLLLFGSGLFLGFLPALLLFALAPQQAFFGNLGYVTLNTRYYSDVLDYQEAMTIVGKISYLAQIIITQPGNLLLLLSLVVVIFSLRRLGSRSRQEERLKHALERSEGSLRRVRNVEHLLLCLLIAFLLIAAFAATPTQEQYLFAVVPFLILALLYGLAQLDDSQKWPFRLFVLATLLTILFALPDYALLTRMVSANEWYPSKAHRSGIQIANLTQEAKVLTLAPTIPLEGAADIYPAFASGPFMWRVASLLPAAERTPLQVVAPEDLASFLQVEPPRGLLVDFHDDDLLAEAPFVSYAKQNRYVPVKLADEGTLWLSPRAEWGEVIRLGGHTSPNMALQAGDSFVLTFYLQNIGPIEQDLNVLVRLIARDRDGDGNEIVNELWRDEGWPFGAATSTWQQGEVWADGHEVSLPAHLSAGYYRLEMSFYDPQTLNTLPVTTRGTGTSAAESLVVDYLALGDLPTEPSAPLSAPAELGSSIRLLGLDEVTTTEVGEGLPTVHLRLFWQAQAHSEKDYTVFVHLLDANGQLVAQQDQQPLAGFFPTSAWRAGQVIADDYQFPLPADAPAGSYELRVGMYDLSTGQRLPVSQEGEAIGDFVAIPYIQKTAPTPSPSPNTKGGEQKE